MIRRTYFFSCVFIDNGRIVAYHNHQATRRSWLKQPLDAYLDCLDHAKNENPGKDKYFVISFNRC